MTEKITKELEALCNDADKVNGTNLFTILSDNCGTEYGRRYGFADIRTVDDYRGRVPITDYEDYREYVKRMMDGEKNVLTVYETDMYCSTSGTTGESKYLPKSYLDLEKEGTLTEDPKKLYLSSEEGKRLILSSYRTYSAVPGGRVFLISEMFYKYIYDTGRLEIDKYIGGKDLFFVPCECRDMLYAKAAAALSCPDIRIIECTFLYEALNFFGYLEKNWRGIVDDLRNRRLPDGLSVPDGTRDFLLSLNTPEERLAEVEKECGVGFDNIAKRLWKKLELINGIGNKFYLTEEASLAVYIGDIPKQYYCYCCSESLLGIPPRLNEYAYVMVMRTGFFEFLPFNAKDDSVTYLPHELKTGELYEPVITNFSGLYRYRLGDIVKVVRFIGKSPVIEFMFRKGQVLNLAGEKIDLRQLEQAVYGLREAGLNVIDYCIGASLGSVPGKYLSVMSVQECGMTDQRASELFDEVLKRSSPDYKELRELGEIAAPEVILCGSDDYESFTAQSGSGKSRSHEKAKHIYPKEVPEQKWKQIIDRIRQGK